MGIVVGGVHGRVSGKLGGVVYGAARTITGKAVTVREKVAPSNPNTVDQILRRNIFKEALYATRHLTATCWQANFNRAIGQLPGFHSMMSIICENTDASEDFTSVPDTPLGNLHFPLTCTLATGSGAAGTFDLNHSTENGLNGTAGDKFALVMIEKGATAGKTRPAVYQATNGLRSSASDSFNYGTAGKVLTVGIFLYGQGAADGLLSPCVWKEVTTHA